MGKTHDNKRSEISSIKGNVVVQWGEAQDGEVEFSAAVDSYKAIKHCELGSDICRKNHGGKLNNDKFR